MMARSPFDILLKQFSDGIPVAGGDDNDQLRRSIQDHLARLFNARQGVLPHLPDYGLPDLTAVYQEMPYSVENLLSSVRKTIEKYEPRLRQVDVKQIDINGDGFVIAMEINGRTLEGVRLKFETHFISGGIARVGTGRMISRERA